MATRVDARITRLDTFERVINNLGNSPALRSAMSRGLNEHLRRQEKQAETVLAAQTGIAKGHVAKGSSVRLSSPANLEGAVRQQGSAIPAGELTGRSWNRFGAGARHRDWPTYTKKGGLMEGTFTIARYGGAIFRRRGKGHGPLAMVWGPVLPNELLRRDMPTRPRAEALAGSDLEKSVIRSIMHSFGF